MIEYLAKDVAWASGTEKELDGGKLSLIGNFFDPPGVNLNNAAARAIWLEAHFKAWWERRRRMFAKDRRAPGARTRRGR
jgi:hypothetical protein